MASLKSPGLISESALEVSYRRDTIENKFALLKSNEPKPESTVIYYKTEVKSVVMTSDEKYIAAGLADGSIMVMNIEETNEDIEHEIMLAGHKDEVKCMCISHDDKILISGSYDCTIRIWNIEDKIEETLFNQHEDKILALALSFDNKKLLSSSMDSSVIIWNLVARSSEYVINNLGANIYTIGLSNNGKLALFGGSSQNIIVWDLDENFKKNQLVGHNWPILSITLTSDSKWAISSGMDKTIRLWDLTKMREEKILAECSDTINSLSVTHDNLYVIYGGHDGVVGILSLKTYQEILITAHSASISSIYISKTSKYMISGSNDKKVRICKLSEYPDEIKHSGHDGRIYSIATSSDSNYMATASDDSKIILWKINSPDFEGILEGHDGPVHSVVYTSDGSRCISGSQDQTIRIWDLFTAKEEMILRGHDEGILSLCLSSDDKYIISGSIDKAIKIWKIDDGSCIATFKGHEHKITSICISTDNLKIYSGSKDKTIRCWSFLDSKEISLMYGHEDEVTCLCLSSNNKRLISGGLDGTMRIWNTKLYYQEGIIIDDDKMINKMLISADDRFLFTQVDRRYIKMWSIPDRQILAILYEFKDILSLALTPDNEWLIISTKQHVKAFKSPISNQNQNTVIPYKYSFIFRSFIYGLLNYRSISPISDFYNYVISPWCITALHVFAQLNLSKLLEDSISANGKFIACATGETPLSISLNKKSKLCAEIIIKLFPIIFKNNQSAFEYLRETLPLLNKSSLPSLIVLYNSAFPVVHYQYLPTFGSLLEYPPTIKLSKTPHIDPSQFVHQKQEMSNMLFTDYGLEWRQSLFSLNLSMGDKKSIKLVRSILKCKQTEIYRTEFIKSLLAFKWQQIRHIMWIQAIVYSCLLLILFIHSVVVRDDIVTLILILIFNSLMLLYEIIQSNESVGSYIREFWNILDMMRICLMYMYPISVFADADRLTKDAMLAILNIVAWVRFVGYFRMFDSTRYMIKILMEVVEYLKPFFVVLFIAILAQTTALYTDSENPEKFKDTWLDAYANAYGNFVNYSLDLQIVIFVFTSLFITLVLLSALVALLTYTLEKLSDEHDIADQQEKAEIILEYDTIHIKGRHKGKNMYLQQCGISIGKHEEHKTAAINLYKKNIEKRSQMLSKCFDLVEKNTNRLEKKMKKREILKKYVAEFSKEILNLRATFQKEIDEFRASMENFKNDLSNRKTFIK
ncbi:unnamed protein product [Blepharisma stoltei]|uniref:Ion transport domain-containing protein n=1 Tax=Blepharisma stoltei TaxID=1481888 RepID=A0AAU9JGV1_9CILI|nr:unnamed protein product [Blepharisma stoltei]